MGVYINMEMPKDKAVAVVIHPDGTAYTAEMAAGVCTEYLADCTAVPVPPHGRLIDADAVEKQIDYVANLDWNKKVGASGGMLAALEIVEDAPTILEAEEGE